MDPEFYVGDASPTELLFGEQQGRFICTVPQRQTEKLFALAREAQVPAALFGWVYESDEILVGDPPDYSGHWATISLADLRAAHEGFLPRLMGADAALA